MDTQVNNINPAGSNTMQFKASTLVDKSSQDVNRLFEVSFEYLLAGLAQVHAKAKRLDTFAVFNEKNQLSRSLLLSYPFFISLSNGHGNALYNLFGNFFSYTYAPASKVIKEYLPTLREYTDQKPYDLSFFKIKPSKIEIKNPDLFEDDYEALKEAIAKTIIKPGFTLSQIEVQKDRKEEFTNLCSVIDNGIKIVKSGAGESFFDGNIGRLTELSSQYDAWINKYNENSIDIINYKEIEEQPIEKRPFYYYQLA